MVCDCVLLHWTVRNKQFDEIIACLGHEHAQNLTTLENYRRAKRLQLSKSYQAKGANV